MALKLILGNSGSGKSTYLSNYIANEAKANPKTRYLVIVPEQYTLQTQRRYALASESGVILNIDVLSFNRLAYRVFEELGEEQFLPLDDLGKSLILRDITSQKLGEMGALKGDIKRPGYIDEIKSLVTELVQYSVTPDMLQGLTDSDGISGLFKSKIMDVTTIYREFLARTKNQYMLSEEMIVHLADLVDKSSYFRDSVIVFDGYTGFTPVQQVFLRKVFPVVRDIYVTFTIDSAESITGDIQIEDLFYLTKKSIKTLFTIADETKVEKAEPILLGRDGVHRFRSSEPLAHFERNIFRNKPQKYDKQCDCIQIANLLDYSQELEYTARQIRHLVDYDGYRYNEIAVVSADVETYGHYVDYIFDKYNIPYFLDINKKILYQPLLECVRGIVDVGATGLSYDAIMRILKTGLIEANDGVIDAFENYILGFGIKGKKLSKKFTRIPRWMKNDAAFIDELEQFRDRLATALIPLEEILANTCCVKDKCVAVWDTIEKIINVPYKNDDDKKIYKLTIDVFEKIAALIGEEELDGRQFKELIDTGLGDVEMSFVPNNLDRVIIGDIERTRLDDIKVLILNGANDGLIPGSDNNPGIFSDIDREWLANIADNNKIELAPTKRQRAFIQRFYLYSCLTQASDRLYITYHGIGSDGKSVRPSYLISTIARLYTLELVHWDKEMMREVVTPLNGLDQLAQSMELIGENGLDSDTKALLKWYILRPEYKERIQKILEGTFYRYESNGLSNAVLDRLYSEATLDLSASSIKKYNTCQYAYFLSQVIGITGREQYGFTNLDWGNLLHRCLEVYGEKVIELGKNWSQIDEATSLELKKKAYEEALSSLHDDSLFETSKNEFIKSIILDKLDKAVDMLSRQNGAGEFRTVGVEISFNDKLNSPISGTLENGKKYATVGKIDRLDIAQITTGDIEKNIISVTDYKTGNTSFSLADIYYGLELQLPIYTMAAKAWLSDVKKMATDNEIGGMFYYHTEEKEIEDKELARLITDGCLDEAEEKFKRLREKQSRLDGIVSSEKGIPELFDKTLSDSADSNVIPIKYNKDGSVSKTSGAYDLKDISTICDYVADKIKMTAESITQGSIEINPYIMGQRSSCDYCEYKSICRFDERIDGFDYRKLSEKDGKDKMEAILEARKLEGERTDA